MVGVTAAVAMLGILLVFIMRPGAAIGVLIGSMLLWPEFLRIPIGPAEMSAPRLVALALLARLIIMGRNRHMKFCAADWLVLFLWLWTVFASIVSGARSQQTTTMIGQGFDTVLMYFVARLAIRSVADIRSLIMPLLTVAALMCLFGWLEATTKYSPYNGLDRYRGWVWIEKIIEPRLGLTRAKVSTSVHIYFGMAMSIITGIAWSLRSDPRVKKRATMAAVLAAFATFASVSSGPWLAIIFLIVCNAYLAKPKYIKPTLYLMLVTAGFLELASNRHFYNLIDYLALNSSTAWYRTRLLEVAVSQWRDYWLVGVGSKSIQYWGMLLDGRNHVDLVNQFLVIAVNGGIPAMLMYIFSHVMGVRYGIKAWRTSGDRTQRIFVFGLICCLISLDISSMSVGLFGPPMLLGNILLGMLVSGAVAWKAYRVPQRVPPQQSREAVVPNLAKDAL